MNTRRGRHHRGRLPQRGAHPGVRRDLAGARQPPPRRRGARQLPAPWLGATAASPRSRGSVAGSTPSTRPVFTSHHGQGPVCTGARLVEVREGGGAVAGRCRSSQTTTTSAPTVCQSRRHAWLAVTSFDERLVHLVRDRAYPPRPRPGPPRRGRAGAGSRSRTRCTRRSSKDVTARPATSRSTPSVRSSACSSGCGGAGAGDRAASRPRRRPR